MAEYIEREALPQKRERGFFLDDDFNAGWNACLGKISAIPAADVRPVVRGKWIEDRTFGPICSVCGHTAAAGYDEEPWHTPYCPFCGADMREES